MCLCISFWNYTYFGYLKGANEVDKQCFHQAVLLCLLKALYYAGKFSYAACIINYYAQNYAGIIRQGLPETLKPALA